MESAASLRRYFFIALWIFCPCIGLLADNDKGYGLKPVTEEHIQHIEENLHWVKHVKPNKLGAVRLHHHLKKKGHAPVEIEIAQNHSEEIVVKKGRYSTIESASISSTNPLPSSVNNTLLSSFPPIGDQRNLGSCVAWGSTYYQATHEIGLLNGTNNKTSSTNILSPKWTYNNLNGGYDQGLNPPDAFELLAQNGATTILNLPYDSNYLSWDLTPQDWISAMSYRTSPPQIVSGIGGTQPQDLYLIKQLLANGHVLTFATFVESWVFTTVGSANSQANPYAGQQAISWMNGQLGGHYITIVGYDDNIWIDVNGNGHVDEGEKGAFLIANSWGADWGNQGLIWISYDAFKGTSAVVNGPSHGRVALGDAMNSYVISILPKATHYSPKLIAQFSLSQTARNQVKIGAGVSDTTFITPSTIFQSGAIVNQGGYHEFDGSKPVNPETATFALDLTDLLTASDAVQRYYLLLTDSTAGFPTTLNTFSLIDQIHHNQVNYAEVPITFDNRPISPYIDYIVATGDVPQNTIQTTAAITSPLNNEVIEGLVNFTVDARNDNGIAKVDFYVDSVLQATETSAPFIFSLDTTHLTNVAHRFSVIAYDNSNNTAQASLQAVVNNASYPLDIFVNAGGIDVNYQDVIWKQDFGCTSPSHIGKTNLSFSNPVYQTNRNGNFSYSFDVADGSHSVTLKFAEINFRKKGKRIFNVIINGTTVASDLDLVKTAGYGNSYDLTFNVQAINNKIKIDFVSVINSAMVSAIHIASQTD